MQASGDVDNAYWGGDRDIPASRLSYQINDTQSVPVLPPQCPQVHLLCNSPGTDSSASASAAFSACSILYNISGSPHGLSPASLQNTSYASTLLEHAVSLHNLSVHASGGQLVTQKSVPQVADAYSSSGYGDDLALSALFLAWASNSSDLYQEAEDYYSKYSLGGQDDVFNWDDRSPALPLIFLQVMSVAPSVASGAQNTSSNWQREAEAYFDRITSGKSRGQQTKG
jgi:endoglucanase